MSQLSSDEVYKLIEQFRMVRDRAMDGKNAACRLCCPGINPKCDARITAFSKLVNVLNSLQLALTFISKHLLSDEWWKGITRENIPHIDKQIYVNEFANFTKVGYVQGIFLAIESSLRLFLRAIDPLACRSGTAEFRSVYVCLFNSKLAASPDDGIVFLDLMRFVRNTIHNNGVYFSPQGIDTTLVWSGNTYEFKHGKPVDFVTWEFLLKISDALHLLLRQVVEDTNLQAIKSEINDPFSR